jgi:membrane protein implicated in regulation of membrane protease activity
MDTIKDFLTPEIIWFLVGLSLLVMELIAPGLIIGFFGIGAWIVAVVCLFTEIGINAQLIVFIASSVLSLVLLRRWLKGIFLGHAGSKQDLKHDLEEFVGQRAVVKEKIVPKLGGKVEFHGSNWEAQADQEIAEGTVVEIVGKNNITFKVKAL